MQKTSDSSVKRPRPSRPTVDNGVSPPAMDIGLGQSTSLHVLVVDDEPMVCDLVERILTDAGHRVRTTNDPHEAIGVVMEESYDLLITDRSMPLMSGEELAAAVKAARPSMRVLLVTGSGSDEVTTDHIDGFLTKPFMPDSLLSELVAIFEPPRRPVSRDRLPSLTT